MLVAILCFMYIITCFIFSNLIAMSFQSEGSVIGHWVEVVQPVEFQSGYNDLILLSQTVGLQVKLDNFLCYLILYFILIE